MGACPKNRVSKLRGRKRRTHYKATVPTLAKCTQCFQTKLAHRVCPSCGHYNRGLKVLEVAEA
ncbi:MAG: 50S ribosomal protein L32 [Candidatus Riflebacteria bacterium]|nr:50S ribosomal protein L32 [Candidatus Riflebacteria bacterium]